MPCLIFHKKTTFYFAAQYLKALYCGYFRTIYMDFTFLFV